MQQKSKKSLFWSGTFLDGLRLRVEVADGRPDRPGDAQPAVEVLLAEDVLQLVLQVLQFSLSLFLGKR